jgi:hypothetical protein
LTEWREDQDWLTMVWAERGVEIDGPVRRQGFGTDLILRRVPYELAGAGTLDLHREGVVATMEFPLLVGDSILQSDPGRLAEQER